MTDSIPNSPARSPPATPTQSSDTAPSNRPDRADESMSDDESMSSSSSAEIAEAVDAVQEYVEPIRPTISDEVLGAPSPTTNLSVSPEETFPELVTDGEQQLEFTALGRRDDDLTTSIPTPKRKRRWKLPEMWLQTGFAPAMAKSVMDDYYGGQNQFRVQDMYDHQDDDEDEEEYEEEESPVAEPNGFKPASKSRKLPWAASHVPKESEQPSGNLDPGVHLVSGQNEVTGVQLRFRSNKPFLLSTDLANWFVPQGHAPRARVHVDTTFVPVSIKCESFVVGGVQDETGATRMEYLDKRGYSPAVARRHAVYLRLRVGMDVPEGVYEIPVRVFTQPPGFRDEELSWKGSVQLRVVNVQLPSPRNWGFHLDLWQHLTSIARIHSASLWSDRHFELIEHYFQPLSELGQKCVTVVATEMPWAGQQCYSETDYPSALFEHAILDVYESDTSDRIQIDFTNFDRLLALASSFGMDKEIEIFGLLSIWVDAANGFDGPVNNSVYQSHSSTSSGTSRQNGEASTLPSIDGWRIRCVNRTTQRVRYLRKLEEVERFLALLHDHCVELGVVDNVRVCADEPNVLSVFYAQMQFFQRAAPRFQVKVAINHFDFFRFAPPQVVDYVPLLPLVCLDVNATNRVHQLVREQKGKLCWYVCCGPAYPNQFVSSPLVEGELVGFLTYFLQLDGFLRWNYCLWPAEPWRSLRWRAPNWKVGDMYFVLPGHDGYPVETLRLESLRFAIQSYELLKMAQRTLPAAEMEQVKSEVGNLVWKSSDFGGFCPTRDEAQKLPEELYSLDPLDYQRARTLVLEALAAHRLSRTSVNGPSAASGSAVSTASPVSTPPADVPNES